MSLTRSKILSLKSDPEISADVILVDETRISASDSKIKQFAESAESLSKYSKCFFKNLIIP